jgi:hypothetical protein
MSKVLLHFKNVKTFNLVKYNCVMLPSCVKYFVFYFYFKELIIFALCRLCEI